MQKLFFIGCIILGACYKGESTTTTFRGAPVAATQPSSQANVAENNWLPTCSPEDTSGQPCRPPTTLPQAETIPPQKIRERCKALIYPKAALRAGRTGSVKANVTVNKEGKVTSIEVIEGTREFIPAAKDYLFKCAYTPATSNGEPIEVTKLEVVTFKIK